MEETSHSLLQYHSVPLTPNNVPSNSIDQPPEPSIQVPGRLSRTLLNNMCLSQVPMRYRFQVREVSMMMYSRSPTTVTNQR